jgi:hypothetical protein
MVQRVVTANDVLDGHVALNVECLDRIYINNAYVPILQTSSRVVAFLSRHLGSRFCRRCYSGSSGTGSAGRLPRLPRPMTFRGSSSARTRPSWRWCSHTWPAGR